MTEVPRAILAGRDADKAGVIRTLCGAFQDDPALAFMIPDAAARRRILPRFFKLVVAEDLLAGSVQRSAADEVVSLWRAPGRHKDVPLGTIRTNLSFVAILGFNLGRGMRIGEAMARHHPAGAHHYLRYLGVNPSDQGKGWGGEALRAGIARANADGLPIYLETAKESNVSLYLKFGFAVVEQWRVPEGPAFWSMMRAAG